MKEAAVLLYIVTLMSCALYIATSSFIVNNNDHNSNSSNYNNFNKRNIINGRLNPKFINFKNTVNLIVKAATCHPLLKPCRDGGKCIRDSNDRIYECRLDNDNNTDGNNNNNNNEMNTDTTIINNNTNSSKDSNSSSSSNSNDLLEPSTIDHNNTSDSEVSITDNNISHGNNSNESIINNSSNESNKNSSGSSSSSSSKNDDNNKSNITRIINDSSNNSSNTDRNFINGNFNHNFITFNNTVDLIVKAATCHPLLKPCRNGGKCIRGSNERIYKCRLDNNNNTNDDDDDDDNKNNNNNNGTFESPVVPSTNCTLNSTECESGETCVKYNGSLQCRTLSVREQYICDLCTNGLCVFQKGGDISCSCKLQWTGDLCSEPCYRNCTIGKCILSQYEEYCECPGNFMPSSNCTEQYNE